MSACWRASGKLSSIAVFATSRLIFELVCLWHQARQYIGEMPDCGTAFVTGFESVSSYHQLTHILARDSDHSATSRPTNQVTLQSTWRSNGSLDVSERTDHASLALFASRETRARCAQAFRADQASSHPAAPSARPAHQRGVASSAISMCRYSMIATPNRSVDSCVRNVDNAPQGLGVIAAILGVLHTLAIQNSPQRHLIVVGSSIFRACEPRLYRQPCSSACHRPPRLHSGDQATMTSPI